MRFVMRRIQSCDEHAKQRDDEIRHESERDFAVLHCEAVPNRARGLESLTNTFARTKEPNEHVCEA